MMTKALGMRAMVMALGISAVTLLATPASAGSTLTRTTSYAYDANTALLTQQVIEPNQSSYRVQSDYTYDAFGNQTSTTVSGTDVASRSAGSTFDAQGRFATAVTNALNQT